MIKSGKILMKKIRLRNKVRFLHIVGVDNILAKLADPFFVGFAESENLPISCKFVTKTSPTEAVGVHVLMNKRPGIKEYTEIRELANERDKNNNLKYY